MPPPRILTIAGSDSSGGAGIQADLKTITMLGGHAMSAITAITAQNAAGVSAVAITDPALVLAQVRAVAADFLPDAIKIGMVGAPETAAMLADWLEDYAGPVVFDPVMVASSGAALADNATIDGFARLIGRADLVTPNLPELDRLGGEAVLAGRARAVLVKGGHGENEGAEVTDRLVLPDGEAARWSAPRIDTPHSHGTGCTLSSAIATLLGHGLTLTDAIAGARQFVRLALYDAPDLVPDNGPLGHGAVRNDAIQPGLMMNQVTLGCTDYVAAVAFYRRLGLTQIVDSPDNGPDNSYARFVADNGATLSLHQGQPVGGAMVYLECADLDARCRRLGDAGFSLEPPRDQPWLWREAYLTDPSGNRICLYQAGEARRHPPWRIGTDRRRRP